MHKDREERIVIWRVLDGKPGHEKQTLGLSNAIASQADAAIYNLYTKGRIRGLWYWIIRRYPHDTSLPLPHIILGAGHQTHFDLLAIRKTVGGMTIVCMKPSLPTRLFNICLIPDHDSPPSRPNIIETKGAITSVQPSQAHSPEIGLMLIGGPSRHYHWDNHKLLQQIQRIINTNSNLNWTIATSRRTPNDFIQRLVGIDVTIQTADTTPSYWVEHQLAISGQVWVTPDSVSMLYESLTSGCITRIFDLLPKKTTKILKEINNLISAGWITNTTDKTPVPPMCFGEATRIAKLLLPRIRDHGVHK